MGRRAHDLLAGAGAFQNTHEFEHTERERGLTDDFGRQLAGNDNGGGQPDRPRRQFSAAIGAHAARKLREMRPEPGFGRADDGGEHCAKLLHAGLRHFNNYPTSLYDWLPPQAAPKLFRKGSPLFCGKPSGGSRC